MQISVAGTVLSPDLEVLRLSPYEGPNAVPIIIGDICCLLFLLYFLYREVNHLIKQKKKYFLVYI